MSTIRAVAVDFDGTLTRGGAPTASVLDAVAAVRRSGLKIVVATGRILGELWEEFPGIDHHCNAIVAENGAVLRRAGVTRTLVPPVEPELVTEFRRRGVHCRQGDVIVAAHGGSRNTITDVLLERGSDHQLIANRSELMVVPSGVTKATGVREALDELGTSIHSAIAIGDAENDHSMLMACELGVAVANAVDTLKRHADVVTVNPDGGGVVEVLTGPLVTGEQRLHPARWQVRLGTDEHGHPVTIPSSQVNLLITGPSGSGKSHTAGMLAEQLISLGYSVLVIDPEGDFEQLGCRPGVVVTGGPHSVAHPDEIVTMLHHQGGSVVVDLSQRPRREIEELYRCLPPLIEANRAATGVPHWIVIDEAHGPLARHSAASRFVSPDHFGYLVVTYHPDELDAAVRDHIDIQIQVARDPLGHAMLVRWGQSVSIDVAPRATPHRRHWHKYATTMLPRDRGFWFRSDDEQLTGIIATSLAEFHHGLTAAEAGVLVHHAAGSDFSRWIDDVFGDHALAARVREAERAIDRSGDTPALEAARRQLLAILEECLVG